MLIVEAPTGERMCENPNCPNVLAPPRGPGRRRQWCSDRCRKTKYAGTCVDCGGPTDGASGRGIAKRCRECRHNYAHATATWTQAAVIAAIQRWHAETGYTPSAREWIRRGSYWPAGSTVLTVFDSWNGAIAAAGFTTRARGHRTGRNNPTWDNAGIITALQAWAAEHGRSPTASDWGSARSNGYPSHATVSNRFGSWNAGLKAAGLPYRARVGGPPKRHAMGLSE
jgi:Homing endonuclease associated repeat